MEVTKTQLADQLGCSKSTVVNAIAALGDAMEGHIVRRGKSDYLDEFAASAIADKLTARFPARVPEVDADGAVEVYKDAYRRCQAELADLSDTYKRVIADKDAHIDRLSAEVAQARRERDDETSSHKADVERLEAEISRLREYAHRLEHAHWWQKRAIINAYGLLPAPKGD